MYQFCTILLIVLLYHCAVINIVECSENPLNNYEVFENIQSFNKINLTAKTVALLVEDNQENFKKLLNLVQTVLPDNQYKNRDYWLVTFNSSGVSSVLEKSNDNMDEFSRKIATLSQQSDYKSNEYLNEDLVKFAAINTARSLPKNSAIVLFTDAYFPLMEKNFKNSTLKNVSNKSIAVYTVNGNQLKLYALIKNAANLPGEEIVTRTTAKKYEIYAQNPPNQTTEQNEPVILTRQNIINDNSLSFQYDMTTNDSPYELYRQDPHNQTTERNVSVILTRKNLISANNLSFPIDNDVTGLHIVISPSKTTEGILVSPNGYTFSFSRNAKAINIRYSQDSFFDNQNGFFELHLNFSTSSRSNIGIWQLKLENLKDFYNVSVFAFTDILAEAAHLWTTTGQTEYEISKDVMKLGVTGNISHITHISVLDSNGETVLSNISYKFNNNRLNYVTENSDNAPDVRNKEVNVEFNRLQNTQPVYALIRGKDIKGNIFQRLSYIFGLGRSNIYPQQFLTVEVGLGSELIATSGKKAEVYFEVTNHASSAQLVTFSCSDNKYILQSLSIYKRYLEPQGSTIITLYLNTKYGIYQDEITFSASSGSLVVQKKVLVNVGAQSTDQNKPDLWYKYTSDCAGVIFTSCTKGTWTVEITARDTESGLLQLNTIPKGLYFPQGYTSGTKDYVTGYFSESCCNPRLQISAVDRMNNVRSHDVNAYFSRLSPGAIAAIVLGIILFIILVALIIFFACRRWKKRKEAYELPTYRGGSI